MIKQILKRIILKLFQKNEPVIRYLPVIGNVNEFKKVNELLPKLSVNERELIIQKIFGRPIRIIKGIDNDGSMWLEGITFFEPRSEGDFNYHYFETIKNKDKNPFG